MNKKLIWLSAAAFALTMGQPGFASSTDNHQTKPCHCNDNKNPSNKLNLSDEQKVKIKAIRADAHKTLKANYQQSKALRSEINKLALEDKIDESKLDSLINQRNKLKTAMLKSHVLMKHQIYSLLTDKQKLQYKEMMKQKQNNG